jgi:hypothetical protein
MTVFAFTTRAAACMGLSLSVLWVLAGCPLSSSGGGSPKAIFQLVITASGGASGTYVWSPTTVPGGVYSRDTTGGGPAAYIFDSYGDGTVKDTIGHGSSEYWFLSSSTSHSTTAIDSSDTASLALPDTNSGGWWVGVLTGADYSQAGAVPTTNPLNPVVAGVVLTVGYHYSDPSGSAENISATQYQWQSSSSQPPTDASFTDISGATSQTYTTSGANSTHYLRIKVTVVAQDGTTASAASASQPVYVP